MTLYYLLLATTIQRSTRNHNEAFLKQWSGARRGYVACEQRGRRGEMQRHRQGAGRYAVLMSEEPLPLQLEAPADPLGWRCRPSPPRHNDAPRKPIFEFPLASMLFTAASPTRGEADWVATSCICSYRRDSAGGVSWPANGLHL